MKLAEIYKSQNKVISFEVFPPKADTDSLFNELKVLREYNPKFVSLTCGAGGKENKAFEMINNIKSLDLQVMPHFTCITSSKETVQNNLIELKKMNIENILALRGDIPDYVSLKNYDFNYANELVQFIKARTEFSVGVAGYPEGHIECDNLILDVENLKRKVDAGADAIFTQLFFDNSKFYKFVELVRKSGIELPIVAGIMPIISARQVEKMVALARITIPKDVNYALGNYSDLVDFGIEYATRQCLDLVASGFKNLHFYTLNKAYSTARILDNMRI